MKKKKMKKNIAIGVFVTFIALVIVMIVYSNIAFNKYKTADIYSNGNEKGEIIETNVDLFKKIKGSDNVSIIYIGRSSCPACVNFYPIIEEVAEEYGLDVYYTNTGTWNANDTEKVLMPAVKNFEGTPTILIMYQRKEVATLVGLNTKDALVKFLTDYKLIRK